MKKLLIIAAAIPLLAQTTVTTIASNDQVSASRDVLNANFAALNAKHLQGFGTPIGAVPCSSTQNRGAFYTRLDAGALFSSAYGCHNTGSGAYAWELLQNAGGSGIGNMLGSNNLSEITSPANARNNLGLGTAATFASTSFESAIIGGLASQVWLGNKTWATLNTSIVPESGNLYFTTSRVHGVLGGTTNNGIPVGNGTSFALITMPGCTTSQKTNYRSGGFVCDPDLDSGGVGAVSSVFGRPGVVVATSGDYTVSQITGAAPLASPAFSGVATAPTATPGTNTTQLATTAFVAALGALKADLANPTLTGSPRAPTATPNTNSTIIATTAYADAIAALKADVTSPTLLGDPKAPTAAAADNDTSIASTAFVQREIDAKTVAVDAGADKNKLAFVNNSGVLGLKLIPTMPPMVFDNGSSTVSASCVVREALSGGTFTGVHLLSVDSATGADISGSVTVQFATSPATGSTTWTNIGTVALSSASRAADTTLSGWTAAVATGQLVRACITGSPTSVQKLIVSPRFF